MKWSCLVGASVLLLTSLASAQPAGQTARAVLRGGQGEQVGTVGFTQESDGVRIDAQVAKVPPGFHGFHVHAVGKCEPPAFVSAGPHFNPAGKNHPEHAGDLPPLLMSHGEGATMSFTVRTTRFRLEDLFDADGSAVIVHANPDNYAHIPADRYRPDPDATTLGTGDAGGRIACGVVTR